MVNDTQDTTDAAPGAAGIDLRRSIASLPPRQRRVMELRMSELSQQETGRVLGLGQRAVAKIEACAIAGLRAKLAPVKLKKAA